MRAVVVVFYLACSIKANGQCNLIMTGILDGPLPGGFPKMIELFALDNVFDLDQYGLGTANNGGGSDGEEFSFPNDTIFSGSFIYVSAETNAFTTFFGFAPNYLTGSLPNSACYFNGNDAVELFYQGQVVDVLGDTDTNGTGTSWEYTDGWLYRLDYSSCNLGSFNSTQWYSSGVGALTGVSDNNSANSPFPLGTYQNIPLAINDFFVNQEIKGKDLVLSFFLFGSLEEEYIIIERSLNGIDFKPFKIIDPNSIAFEIKLRDMESYNYIKVKLIDNDGSIFKEQKLGLEWPSRTKYICYTEMGACYTFNSSNKHVIASIYPINSQSFTPIKIKPNERVRLSDKLQNQVVIVVFRDLQGRFLHSTKVLL